MCKGAEEVQRCKDVLRRCSRCRRGAEVQRCRGAEVQRCRGGEVNRWRGEQVNRCRGVEAQECWSAGV